MTSLQENRRHVIQVIVAFILGGAAWLVMLQPQAQSIEYTSGRMAISCLLLAVGAIAGSFSDRSNYLIGPCSTTVGFIVCAFGWFLFVLKRGGPLVSLGLISVVVTPILITSPAAVIGVLGYEFWRAVVMVQQRVCRGGRSLSNRTYSFCRKVDVHE